MRKMPHTVILPDGSSRVAVTLLFRGADTRNSRKSLRRSMDKLAIQKRRDDRGVGIVELVIVMALISVVTTIALLEIRSSRGAMRVQNSVRQLASYMEKARVDAVRRRGNASVTFTDTRTYTVNMDFNNSGSATARSFTFQDDVQIASSELPSVTFNWRGRTNSAGTSCITTFA